MANVKMVGNDIKNNSGQRIGYVQGNDIKNNSGQRIGYVQGDDIKDNSGQRIGTLGDARRTIEGGYGGTTLAAIWILFVR